MPETLRCKMRVSEVTHTFNSDGSVDQERVKLCAVYGEQGSPNVKWAKWTPSANFEIQINNPNAFGQLSKGHEYFVDFLSADEAAG